MNYNRVAAIALQPAMGSRLASLIKSHGHWDGICRVESEPAPASEESPPVPATPPTSSDPTNEPLGEGGLKALHAEREQRKALEQQLKAFQRQFEGVDPTQFQELLSYKTQQEQAAAAQRQKELEDQQQYEAAKQQLVEEYNTKIGELQNNNEQTLQQLKNDREEIAGKYESLRISTALHDAFLKANGDPAKLAMLDVPAIRGQVALDGDKVKVADSDKSIEQWMSEQVKPGFLFLFKPEGTASGSGTPPSSSSSPSGSNGMSWDEFSKMTPNEQSRLGRRKG